MKPKTKKKPTPEELLLEVQGQEVAKTYEFEDYLPVIHALQQKGNSYAEIAGFIKDRLGITASRGQVYRAYQIWLEEVRQAEEGMEDAERFDPGQPLEEEYEQRVRETAIDLIDELQQHELRGNNEPWNDPETILGKAYEIVVETRKATEAAESAASEADKQLEAKKGKDNAGSK